MNGSFSMMMMAPPAQSSDPKLQAQCTDKYPWTTYRASDDKCVCSSGIDYNEENKSCSVKIAQTLYVLSSQDIALINKVTLKIEKIIEKRWESIRIRIISLLQRGLKQYVNNPRMIAILEKTIENISLDKLSLNSLYWQENLDVENNKTGVTQKNKKNIPKTKTNSYVVWQQFTYNGAVITVTTITIDEGGNILYTGTSNTKSESSCDTNDIAIWTNGNDNHIQIWSACNVWATAASEYKLVTDERTSVTKSRVWWYYQWGNMVSWNYQFGWFTDNWGWYGWRGPCATWYHVPTRQEWEFLEPLGINEENNPLKLPFAGSYGYYLRSEGRIDLRQNFWGGYYWSSNWFVDNDWPISGVSYFNIIERRWDISHEDKTEKVVNLYSVRCIKDNWDYKTSPTNYHHQWINTSIIDSGSWESIIGICPKVNNTLQHLNDKWACESSKITKNDYRWTSENNWVDWKWSGFIFISCKTPYVLTNWDCIISTNTNINTSGTQNSNISNQECLSNKADIIKLESVIKEDESLLAQNQNIVTSMYNEVISKVWNILSQRGVYPLPSRDQTFQLSWDLWKALLKDAVYLAAGNKVRILTEQNTKNKQLLEEYKSLNSQMCK